MFGTIDSGVPAAEQLRGHSSNSRFFTAGSLGLSNVEWATLMDTVRREKEWTDTQLGKCIGISLSMIRQCRTHSRPVPPAARVRLMAAMGVEMSRTALLAALPAAVKTAVEDADANSSSLRKALIYDFFDRLDAGEDADVTRRFIDGLAEIAGTDLTVLADRLGVTLADLVDVRGGKRPIPFHAKMTISESFSTQALGTLVISLHPSF